VELEFDLPSGGNNSKYRKYKMRIDEFVDKWHNGANRLGAKPKLSKDLSNIIPDKEYTAVEIANLLELSISPINKACRDGLLLSRRGDNDKTWMVMGSDVIDWRNSTPEENRFDIKKKLSNMRIRQVNEDTGEIQWSNVTNAIYSGEKEVFEIELENGYKIKCTKDHRIFTEDGWKTLNDFDTHYNGSFVSFNTNHSKIATNGLEIDPNFIISERDSGKTLREIAQENNIKEKSLRNFCESRKIKFTKKQDIPNEDLIYKDRDWLITQKESGLTNGRIAEICNTTEDRIKNSCKKNGISGYTGVVLAGNRKRKSWNTGKKYHLPDSSLVNVRAVAKKRIKVGSYKDMDGFDLQRIRFMQEVRVEIMEKYNYTCQISGSRQKLELHHIVPVWYNKELTFDKNNLIPLHQKVHDFIHANHLDLEFMKYYQDGNDLTQFVEKYNGVRLTCDEINKPKAIAKTLVVRFFSIKNIKYVGFQQTYDIEIKGPYHNFIANGFVVHNSSRAIPNFKMRDWIRNNMFIPFYWGSKRKGMQAGKPIKYEKFARLTWVCAAYCALGLSWVLDYLKVHKQLSNRILEPFSYIKVIYTTSQPDNLFHLRCDSAAMPEIQKIVRMMAREYRDSIPTKIEYCEWHLPYILDDERTQYPIQDLLKFSAARCARVSYQTFDGKPANPDDDFNTFNKLICGKIPHSTPTEHQAMKLRSGYISNNCHKTFLQYRDLIPNNVCKKFDYDSLTDEDFVL
jgi:hypothetical protein